MKFNIFFIRADNSGPAMMLLCTILPLYYNVCLATLQEKIFFVMIVSDSRSETNKINFKVLC